MENIFCETKRAKLRHYCMDLLLQPSTTHSDASVSAEKIISNPSLVCREIMQSAHKHLSTHGVPGPPT